MQRLSILAFLSVFSIVGVSFGQAPTRADLDNAIEKVRSRYHTTVSLHEFSRDDLDDREELEGIIRFIEVKVPNILYKVRKLVEYERLEIQATDVVRHVQIKPTTRGGFKQFWQVGEDTLSYSPATQTLFLEVRKSEGSSRYRYTGTDYGDNEDVAYDLITEYEDFQKGR